MHRSRTAWILALLSLAACGPGDSDAEPEALPPVTFRTATACIVTATDTLRIPVELAEDEAQRAYGLMERDSLAASAGMLFIHPEPQPAESGYWMYRTRVPLDIAYLGPEGRIRSIQTMAPCPTTNPQFCPAYPAGVEYQAALEVNRGFFARHGIGVGDRVHREGEGPCPGGET